MFVEYQSSRAPPKARDCGEADEVSLGSAEWCYDAAGECAKEKEMCDWPGQCSQPSPSSLLLTTSSAETSWRRTPFWKLSAFLSCLKGWSAAISLAVPSPCLLVSDGDDLPTLWHVSGGVFVSFQPSYPCNQSSFKSCSLVASTALQSLGKEGFLGSDSYWTNSLQPAIQCHRA